MYLDKEYYTSHIREEDKIIEMRKLLDKIEIVLNNHRVQKTNFLDPYEIYLAKSILNRFQEISYQDFGGYNNSERNFIIIYPEYSEEDPREYLDCLKIEGDFKKINHRDLLGAVLSLGIDRSKIGDIVVLKDWAYVFCAKEISSFIIYNLEKISNQNINISMTKVSDIEVPEAKYNEVKKFLTSLRLDLIISNTLNISRNNSLNLIKKNIVKVNHKVSNRSSEEVYTNDLISVRGYGRFYIHSIEGKSKKNNYICIIRILI